MAQNGRPITVTIDTAGVAQRVVTDANSPLRYVPWVYFEAFFENTGDIFVGNEDVAEAGPYIARLVGASVDRSFNWNPYAYPASPRPQCKNQNLIDLYNVWVDAAVSGETVFATIPNVLL